MNRLLPEPRRILFLFSDTGGGHRSASEAIIEALSLCNPGQISCEMVDVFKEYAPPPFDRAPQIYPPLTRMPDLWKMGYILSDGPRRTRAFYNVLWPYVRRNIRQLLSEHPCDLVVSVHPLINVPVARLAVKSGIPFLTVITDLVTTHAAWYAMRASHIIVPTEIAYKRGLKVGIKPEQMTVVGLPVAERFRQEMGDRVEMRRKLGWLEKGMTVLMVGGGEGMGPLEAMAQAIDDAKLPVSLVIIAGRNKALKVQLERRAWNIPVKIYGFVNEMPNFMHAADVLVTKAGPGTISEAFISGLPIILYSRIPGQEDGNVTYVVETGAGVWAPTPEETVATLRRWIKHPEEREKAAKISQSLARPDASRQIAAILARRAGVS